MNKKIRYLNDGAESLPFIVEDDSKYRVPAEKDKKIMAPIPDDWEFLSESDRRFIILKFFSRAIGEMVNIFEDILSPMKLQHLFNVMLDDLIQSERQTLMDNDQVINKMLRIVSEFIFGARVKRELMQKLVQTGFLNKSENF